MSKGTAKASDSESDDSDLPSLIPCTDDEVDADIWIVVFFKMYICSKILSFKLISRVSFCHSKGFRRRREIPQETGN